MKILIGTPIHAIKDYSMELWLANVAKLIKRTPADLLLVDNSPDEEYMDKVKSYCQKLEIKKYKLKHIDVHQENGIDERIGRSREAIRQEILDSDYDVWFSWESDQIIQPDSLDKLVKLMQKGNYMIVSHASWRRDNPTETENNFGCALIKRECLEKYGFLLEYPDMPTHWHRGENWFKAQVLKGGGNYAEVFGLIKPIIHLNK